MTMKLRCGKVCPEMEPTGFPLCIPEVMQEVMSYLSVFHLKKCRLVCSMWEERSRHRMRSFVKVTFKDEKKVKEYCNANQKYGSLPLAVHFVFRFPPFKVSLRHPDIQTLLVTYGEDVKSIQFDKMMIEPELFKELLMNQMSNLEELTWIPRPDGRLLMTEPFFPSGILQPKIKHLRLCCEWNRILGSSYFICKDLMGMFPNLEKVTALIPGGKNRNEIQLERLLYFIDHCMTNEVQSFPETLVEDVPYIKSHTVPLLAVVSPTGPPLPNLKDLNLRIVSREDSLVGRLLNKGLKLEKLNLGFPAVQTVNTIANFSKLFTSYSNTLTHLKLKFPRTPYFQSFPPLAVLTNLADLTITGYEGHLDFINNMEKLQKLTLIRVDLRRAVIPLEGNNISVPLTENKNMKTLEVFADPRNEYKVPAPYEDGLLITLTNVFTNLARLRLENANDSNLRTIFSHFSKLRELYLTEGSFTDAGVIGYEIGRSRFRNYPRISDLKSLMTLRLESRFMTDESVVRGLVHCRNLKHLTLMSYQITNRAIQFLVDSNKVALSSLTTEYCYQITLDCKRYAENNMCKRGSTVSINAYGGPLKQIDIVKILKQNRPRLVITRLPY